MKSKMKKVVLALGGSAAALVLAVVVFVLTFDINSYKHRGRCLNCLRDEGPR